MTDQIFFAILQNADIWPTSDAKSVPKDTTAPIHVHVRHANRLFGSTERMIDGLDHVVWLMVLCMSDPIFFALLPNAEI